MFKVRDQVEIISSTGDVVAAGTIVNINKYREEGMQYAVQIEGLDDFVFVGKSELKLKERK